MYIYVDSADFPDHLRISTNVSLSLSGSFVRFNFQFRYALMALYSDFNRKIVCARHTNTQRKISIIHTAIGIRSGMNDSREKKTNECVVTVDGSP